MGAFRGTGRSVCGRLGWLGAGVPNSMGSYTQGGRYVSGLALCAMPYQLDRCVCLRGVHRCHAFPGGSVGQGWGP